MKFIVMFLSLFYLSMAPILSQEKIMIDKSTVSQIIMLEKNINPNVEFLDQKVTLSKEFYPLMDRYVTIDKPIIAYREAIEYLPVYAEYFFTPTDSIIRLTSYNWEKNMFNNIFKKQEMWKEESEKLDIYNSEYDRIRTILTEMFGEALASDSVAREQDGNNGKIWIRDTVWETNDYYASLKMIFGGITYRIRLKHYWKE